MMREFLEQRCSEIVNQWLSQMASCHFTQGLSSVQVVDTLEDYLHSVSQPFASSEGDDRAAPERARILEAHITTRLRQGFNIDDVVREYFLLGEAVSRALASVEPNDAPGAVEVDRFYGLLNAAVSTAVTSFGRHLLEDEQNEKRNLRLLDDIATAALGEPPPLEGRVEEIVHVIQQALDAETVTLLLFDPVTKQLAASARAGAQGGSPCDAMLDSGSIAARAAAARDSFAPDADPTKSDAASSALANGVNPALAHRLCFKEELIGVLCISLTPPRRFGVTDRRRLRTLAEHLALLIANARLFNAVRETVDRLKAEQSIRERFVAVLAHDLRGPLSVVKLGIRALLKELDDAKPGRDKEVRSARRELVVKIDRNVDRTDRMVRDLLDTNRIHAGEPLPVRLAECDLAAIARDVAEEAGPERNRIIVNTEPAVRGMWDEEQLRRALWNLVSNALKYGASDTPVTVSISSREGGVNVTVHNEGAGLDANERARLFDPFRRGSAAQKSGTRGWGLGLTLVRGSAAALGGDVTVESEVGKGATFTLRLPWDSRVRGDNRGGAA